MRKGIRLVQGLFLSYIVTGIVLLLCSFLMYKMAWEEKTIRIGIIVTYVLSTVIGGFYVGRKVETRRMLFGLAFGILYISIIVLVSMVINSGQPAFSGNFITISAICVVGSILGGILS